MVDQAKSGEVRRRVGQIAIVASDGERSCNFYASVFGMSHIFGTTAFRGELAEKVQGLSNAASSTDWLIDDRERFQLEIFEFESPLPRPLTSDHCISDEGYNRIIIAVRSVQDIQRKAIAAGGTLLSLPVDANELQAAHGLLKDPDGILLEIVEAPDLLPEGRIARMVGLGITTLDMETTEQDMCKGFGFAPCSDVFDNAVLWSESGRLMQSQTLQLEDMYLVVSQYRDARPRPEDYRLSDIGVMNFAIFFRDQAELVTCYETTCQLGMRSNVEPILRGPDAAITYNNDRQGMSVEMIFMKRKLWGLYGFSPPRLTDRLFTWLMEWKSRRDYRRHVSRSAV